MFNTIKIKIHTAQFIEDNGCDWDEVKTLEFDTAKAANEYVDNQLTEIDQNWRDMWGENARIFQDIGYIKCDVYGEPGVYEIFEILEIDGVKIR